MIGNRRGGPGRNVSRQRVWRHEEKYLLSEAEFTRLYWQLRAVLPLDPHAILPGGAPAPETAYAADAPYADPGLPPLTPPGQYPGYYVRSLYFDTIERHSLFEKLAGVDHRFKYRIRIYNNQDSVIHFEKKMKRNKYCHKESLTISRAQVDALLAGDIAWLLDEGPLGQELFVDMRTRMMAPLVLVDYHRIPFVWPADEIRITFDRQLSTGLFRTDLFDPQAALYPALAPGEVVLEVKYNHFLPDYLRRMLASPGLPPIAVSKYALCCRDITPGLWGDPADDWDQEWTYNRQPRQMTAAKERIEWHE